MKTKAIISAIILTILCVTGLGRPANVYAEEIQPEQPEVAAQGAILMDALTGRVLWGKNADQPLPMASTTKIMTAILALESGRRDETVTVSSRAASAPKVKMDLTTGEKVLLGDLLYALMLVSSNDAAVAIAEHISGSVEAFCADMTQKATSIGAKDTVFETPNGLDLGDHHSTARDMALITRYAITVPGFLELINTPETTFSSDRRSYSFVNHNRLLHEFDGANGVKTGFTGLAGHCFVGAAKRDDMQLISVVLASGWGNQGKTRKWADTKELLNYGFKNYGYETLIQIGDKVSELPVTRSRNESVGCIYASDLTLPIRPDEKANFKICNDIPQSMQAPIKRGETVGTAKVYIGDELCDTIFILADCDIARHDYKTSLEKILNSWLMQGTGKAVRVVLPEFH